MTTSLTAALFDVDGTLVDSNYLHVVTWWQAFGRAGFEVPMAAIHRAVGMGSDQLLDAVLPADRDGTADEDAICALSSLYATYWSRLRPLPRAADLLRACKTAGLQVVLSSSADPPEFAALQAALDADDAIDATMSAGDVDQSEPAPDLVQVALDKAEMATCGGSYERQRSVRRPRWWDEERRGRWDGWDPGCAGDLGRPVFVEFSRVLCVRPPLTDAERAAGQEEREAGERRYKEVPAAFRAESW